MVMVGVTGTDIGQGEHITKSTPGGSRRTAAFTTAGHIGGITINVNPTEAGRNFGDAPTWTDLLIETVCGVLGIKRTADIPD